MSRILILGGYGGFGARLSRRLAARGHDILVAGRHLGKAAAFCDDLPNAMPVVADRDGDLGAVLAEHHPDLLIDAAGPFQGSGHHVVQACIDAQVHYLDLADGRAFVAGISMLDGAAKEAGVAVVSGASSVPALSGAVIRNLTIGMERVTAVEMAISASNRAAAGASVAAAILSYAGKPLSLWRGARRFTSHGWQEMRRERFALRDGTALSHRLVALADVPDLDLLPGRLPGKPAVIFRAGTELAFQNLTLWMASWLVRWGWLGSLAGLARWLLPLQRLTAGWGSDRSAMVVRVFGLVAGRRVERRWTLIASDGDGPEIPTLAAEIIADRIAGMPHGAGDAGPLLDLADFEPSFTGLSIRHESEEFEQRPALYDRVMGVRFAALPLEVRAMHQVLRDGGASGRATVERGRNPLARLIGALMRFPAAGEHTLHVGFREEHGVERWTRTFSDQAFHSNLCEESGQLVERFGPLRFRFDLPSDEQGLTMLMRGWSVLRLPLPLFLAPRTVAREWVEDGRFKFDVPIALPLIGPVIHYRGWLVPA
ncbi:DUF4166 domain-containing protein [Sphingomonas sp. So64.6b]|uniref:SDR family oxidoreductase n=1 Tax=Sphingomonas sp. So64.6b TaxID=2997354 RepID=UPI0016045219|nr:SDR family oxidoreductase [Sphingomonas sp. So64.6b]QNA82798.1 DUF4166 domain-containing protein [Sphingomonas sp. So64.6b]